MYRTQPAVAASFPNVPSCCQRLTAPAGRSPGAGQGGGRRKDLPSKGPPRPPRPALRGPQAACKSAEKAKEERGPLLA